jgi:hypothetical protein
VRPKMKRLRAWADGLPEKCVRRERSLVEHTNALNGTVMDVLRLQCCECGLDYLDKATVEQVILLPTLLRPKAFVNALEVYRQHLIDVVAHRGRLRGEAARLRWLCGATGNEQQLEDWRALMRLGG